MARKRLGGRADSTDAEREHIAQERAREIGRLQKQARADDRERDRRAPPPTPQKLPPQRLFGGGAKESSLSETHDDAFRAADIMRSRLTKEDEHGEVERYKRGEKKGQPKFRQHGSLAEQNKRKLAPFKNKEIRIKIRFDHVKDGGRYRKTHHRYATIPYTDYAGVISAYQDAMRTAIGALGSGDGFEVESVDFAPVEPPPRKKDSKPKRKRTTKRKGKKKKSKRKRKSGAKARVAADADS